MTIFKHKNSLTVLTGNDHPVILFLCTPGCGTQSLASNLNEVYSSVARIWHEPLENQRGLQAKKGQNYNTVNSTEYPAISSHLNYVKEQTRQNSYIEVCWQSSLWFSELYNEFGKRLRLIHLYRNPVNVAALMVKNNWYTGDITDRLEYGDVTPFNEDSILPEYRSRWNNLTLFEKSLYHWTEANLRILRIKKEHPQLPIFPLKFENLFSNNKELSRKIIVGLLQFMGLDYKEKILEAVNTQYSDHSYQTTNNMNWPVVFNHPKTVKLANALGYTFGGNVDLHKNKKKLV